uniref:Uncharacterized protein n=1 Tax=Parascaris univalens TaxID=6257 RepID=A0A915BCU8_PARUN
MKLTEERTQRMERVHFSLISCLEITQLAVAIIYWLPNLVFSQILSHLMVGKFTLIGQLNKI